jgi:hypothetical protein
VSLSPDMFPAEQRRGALGSILGSGFLEEDIAMTSRAVVNFHVIALATGALLLGSANAGAVDGRVRSACTSDYLTYCSQHDPDGSGTRRCMRANGPRLSQSCLNALVAAGEVSKREVSRRSASK